MGSGSRLVGFHSGPTRPGASEPHRGLRLPSDAGTFPSVLCCEALRERRPDRLEAHLAATVSTVRAYVALSKTLVSARSWNHEAGVVGFTTQRFPSKWVSGKGGCPVPCPQEKV